MGDNSSTDLADVDAVLADRTAFLVGLRDTTFFDVNPSALLGLDDAALGSLRVSAVARATFLASADSLESASLAGSRGQAPAFAMLRAALEAAAVTIWLLESDDPTVRATRLLSEVWGDIRDSDRLATALGGATDSIDAGERNWSLAHAAVFGESDASARQMPTSMSSKIDVAATVVAEFTEVPNAAAVIRSSWQAFGSLARGRTEAFDLAGETASFTAMIAGSRSLVLDVLETAASLYHVRAVASF